MEKPLVNPYLAFLSVHDTAIGDNKASDEPAFHMRWVVFVGFSRVVGTTGSIADSDARFVPDDYFYYRHLSKAGPGTHPEPRYNNNSKIHSTTHKYRYISQWLHIHM